jgi:hypothetical protein
VQVIERSGNVGGEYVIRVACDAPAMAYLAEVGRMPLPPYIRREKVRDDRDAADRERYQTVYAKSPARWPRRRRGCTSPRNCSPSWTPAAWSGRSSRFTSASARFSR